MSATLLQGDALAVLRTLPDGAARCCVTSPPYWGLRDYGHAGQLGLERTPEEYVANMVAVFREVRRVLADDGTLWLNLGDSYAATRSYQVTDSKHIDVGNTKASSVPDNLKPKDLVGIPWRVAFALQADGWYLRSDIIWAKPNPMPESVTDRPTKSHEYLFLLAKSERYYYDAAAVGEPATSAWDPENAKHPDGWDTGLGSHGSFHKDGRANGKSGNKARVLGVNAASPHRGSSIPWEGATRNARTVWTIPTMPYKGAHFATFPEELARRCILAGSAPGDTVLDPFGGSGTVAQVATGNGRSAIHIDLNPAYIELARQRIGPMLCTEDVMPHFAREVLQNARCLKISQAKCNHG